MSVSTVLKPGEGESYFLVGDHATFKLGAEQTGGAYTFAENYTKVDGGPPPHRHAREDELFHVVTGTVRFEINGTPHTCESGTFMHVPKGTMHTFTKRRHDAGTHV
jgi:quercetin dioxygenase-like cupin family protein